MFNKWNKWNISHWVKYANVRIFSDTYFPYTSLDHVHIRENLAYRKSLYFYILCSVQLSLLVNLGAILFSIAFAKFCTWNAKPVALCRTEIFKKTFLPYTINEWKKIDPEICRIDSYVGFRNKLNLLKIFWKFSDL